MHKLILTIIIVFSSFQLSACSSNDKYHRVMNHRARISTLGFTISPPPGKGWYEKNSAEHILYFKKIKTTTYSLTTRATELIFKKKFTWEKDFLEYVIRNKELNKFPENRYRNSNVKYNIEELLPILCVRYQQRYEDYGDKGRGNFAYVKVVNNGRICQHPGSPSIGIELNYTEKSIPQANNPSYRNEGETFLSNLRFISQ